MWLIAQPGERCCTSGICEMQVISACISPEFPAWLYVDHPKGEYGARYEDGDYETKDYGGSLPTVGNQTRKKWQKEGVSPVVTRR